MGDATLTCSITDATKRPVVTPVIPHLEQYSDIWAMYERSFRSVIDHINGLDLYQHAAQAVQSEAVALDENVIRVGDVAVVNLVGFMTKYGSSLSELRGGTVGLRRSIRLAVADEDVRALLLKIDSPGGAVAGTSDLADDVRTAAGQKPVWAYIEDLGASAAYYVASQATKIIANGGAVVGSIGVYGAIYDWSGAYAAAGVKAVVIRSAEFKGIGVRGTEITDAQKADMQRTTDQIHALFVQAVATGRKLTADQAAELADGRVYVGRNALEVKLVDKIGTFDEALSDLAKVVGPKPNERNRMMATETNATVEATASPEPREPVAATYEQLKGACPSADPEFICSQLEANATADQATKAWMNVQQKRVEEANKRADQAEAFANRAAKAAAPTIDGVGTAMDGDGQAGGGSAAEQWKEALATKVNSGMDRAKAVRAIVKENPELHQAYIDEANQKIGEE